MTEENNHLWTSSEIAAAVGGEKGSDFFVDGVEIDSRAVNKNDLFIALKVGRDGHDFATNALNQGAGGVLLSNKAAVGQSDRYVLCNDTMVALENLAAAARRRAINATRCAITGSVGKTTTKELTAAALSATAKTHKSVKSYNNQWGVPLTLSRMPKDTRFGVFEIGMNHAGEIARLVPQVKPNVAAITTVAPVHIEHFGTLEAIADAKSEIFLGIEAGGKALLPADNAMINRLKNKLRDCDNLSAVTFGIEKAADAKVIEVKDLGDYRLVTADILGNKAQWQIAEPGEHWIHNSICAITLSYLMGANLEAACEAVSKFGALEGRGAEKNIILPNGAIFSLVDEAYNANPTAVSEALHTLTKRKGARKIAVLGDMLELGDNENQYHADLLTAVIDSKVDLVFLAGKRMKYLWDVLPDNLKGGYAETSSDLLPLVTKAVQNGDCIMVKGSNGSRMNIIVAGLSNLAAK